MILIAIGSNLPDAPNRTSRDVCEDAVSALAALPGLRLVAVSRWYRSAPVPTSAQPDYVNGVARLEGHIDPAALLSACQTIEHSFGRVRTVPNAARTLDLDIIAIGNTIRDAPDPILPHPRAHERAFVLLPLCEVASDWIDPRSGSSMRAMIEAVSSGDNPDQPVALF